MQHEDGMEKEGFGMRWIENDETFMSESVHECMTLPINRHVMRHILSQP